MTEEEYFEECFRAEEMAEADVENLKIAVTSKYFKRAVKVCLEGVQAKQQDLTTVDLTTPEGVSRALKTQGQIQGMHFVISELYILAHPEPEEEEETEDGGE